MIHCILFDLDGTLIDSLTDLTDCLNAALTQYHLPTRSRAQVRGYIGDGVGMLIQRATNSEDINLNRSVLDTFKQLYRRDHTRTTRLYSGVRRILPGLAQKYTLGLITNKQEEFARLILRSLGVFNLFKIIIGGDTLSVKKPHPGVVLEATRRLRCNPAQTVVVGDHHADLAAARSAGSLSLFCDYGIGRTAGHRSQNHIRSFFELPRALSSIHSADSGHTNICAR
ncbi:MAG: HAD-IA family hydrolase [Leptospiraceae bacterium]|nr:HAD-IA family hydrolase [Leptospiraceae bacterium]